MLRDKSAYPQKGQASGLGFQYGDIHTVLQFSFLLQTLFARWLQACLGNPTSRKGHVYYTKLITNATKLQIAIVVFTASRICYKIVHRVYFMSPNETLISLRSFLPIVIFNIRHGSILVSLLTLSRGIIHLVKSVIRIPRPYESFPDLVQSDKRKFNTFSFPSQSMQSIAIVYGAIFRQCTGIFYYLLLLLIGFPESGCTIPMTLS